QTPGAPDFYFLGIGGDGTQEIFYRELKFVQQVLTDKFQLGERSLLLVNNLRAADQHPLATRISLQRGVAAVAQKMDPAQDVLVVYLTSHGSEDHKIYTAIPGLELPPIANTELAEILNQAPVQWKIVIVSACYSGGFMPGLQNDNTLVITASRADRQSFGCDDKNEMTYFARAYFKEALAQTPDFIQAFERAQVLIKEWEEKDFPDDERSEPQIFIGAKIRAHLSGQNK
ncbi:MAG TPA: C13 family peptidase, partial [Cellvibrio sp.]|nr:C13 family peptidase [Cellvibrio sp.]